MITVDRKDIASGVRRIQLGIATSGSPQGDRWEVTEAFLAAWESVYTVVTVIKSDDMFRLERPRTIAGLPFSIKNGDGMSAILLAGMTPIDALVLSGDPPSFILPAAAGHPAILAERPSRIPEPPPQAHQSRIITVPEEWAEQKDAYVAGVLAENERCVRVARAEMIVRQSSSEYAINKMRTGE